MKTDMISTEFISDFDCKSLSDTEYRILFASDFDCKSLTGTEEKPNEEFERIIIPEVLDENDRSLNNSQINVSTLRSTMSKQFGCHYRLSPFLGLRNRRHLAHGRALFVTKTVHGF